MTALERMFVRANAAGPDVYCGTYHDARTIVRGAVSSENWSEDEEDEAIALAMRVWAETRDESRVRPMDTKTTLQLASMLNACLRGGPVPQAALEAWSHEKLVNEGYVTVVGRGTLCRYKVTAKGLGVPGVSKGH